MGQVAEFNREEGALCQFLTALDDAEMDWLLNSPFFGTELTEHTAFCKDCGGRAEMVFDQMVLQDERDQGTIFLREFFESLASIAEDIEFGDSEVISEKPILAFAARAATDVGGDNLRAGINYEAPIPFGTFMIGADRYDVADDNDGQVYLGGPIPAGMTHLAMGSEAYELSASVEVVNLYLLVGAASADVSEFLSNHELDAENNPISFERRVI